MAKPRGGSPAKSSASATAKVPAGPRVVVPSPQDLDEARTDALLQLKIGRTAHYYSLIVSLALLLDGVVVGILQPDLNALTPGPWRLLAFLSVPVGGAVFLSFVGVWLKWQAYQLWPWEAHFSLSIASVGFSLLLAFVYLGTALGVGPTAHWDLLPWFYPISLAGISLPMGALALTWSEWSQRKTISLVSAVLPIPISLALYLPGLSFTGGVLTLAYTLAVGAFLYLMSGSFLHLMSSGTRAHEREVISSNQGRLFQVAEELRGREDAVRFREASITKREADAEDAEDTLLRQRQSLDEARRQFAQLEQDHRNRSEALSKERQQWALQAAEANAMRRAVEDKEAAIAFREQELQTRLPRLTEREQNLIARESDLARAQQAVADKGHEIDRRTAVATDTEARLETRRQELERRTAELLRKEAEFQSKGQLAQVAEQDRATAKQRLASVDEREARLNQLKLTLDEQNASLGRKAQQLEAQLKEADARTKALNAQEQNLADRELSLRQTAESAKEQEALGSQRRQTYEEAVQKLEQRLSLAERREAEIGARAGDVSRLGATLQAREGTIKEQETRLEAARVQMERDQRELRERERALAAREAEVSLRSQAVAQRGPLPEPPAIGLGRIPPEAPAPLSGTLSELTDHPQGTVRRLPDRDPTGLPRLDDLLLGGLPAKAHVLLIGPPFVGKEIALYSFLSEGLKRGEPAVILTAARSPDELAPEIGVLTPQFREYEQMGKVLWIDASGSPAPTEEDGARGRMKVGGPGDLAGILSSLVQACGRVEKLDARQFRVGFLGLSSALVHADPRQSLGFVQNMIGILKPRPVLGMYSIESGSIPDPQLESLQGRVDGAIRFKEERGKTSLSAQGFGEVATRDWVEYRATNRTLIIGSFALERIR